MKFSEAEAVVIGAGFAGLGTASALRRRGVDAVVLEQGSGPGTSWRNRYDSLRLNTLRSMSTLRGYRMPRRYGRWPSRDQLVEYLGDFAREEQIPVECETSALRIDREAEGWAVQTSNCALTAAAVVVATGYDREPKLPDVPGVDSYEGELVHAAHYRRPEPYAGRDVLVIAPGNSGSEIAAELAANGAARVRTAMRTVPNVFRREWLGIPTPLIASGMDRMPVPIVDRVSRISQRVMVGDLSGIGFGPPSHGLGTSIRVRKVAPVIDAGFIDAVRDGAVELVAPVTGFEGNEVLLKGGARLAPDAVIAATGYRRALEPLVGHLGLLDEEGEPTHNGVPANPAAPLLYFVGYDVWYRGQLPKTSADARRTARAIARELKRG